MHTLFGIRLDICTYHARETETVGQLLGESITQNLLIALRGDLGAGKTTFTKGIARGLGVEEPITSPTFTFVNEYTGGGKDGRTRRLFHVDVYRLSEGPLAVAEAETIGLDDLLDELEQPVQDAITICVVEWAERLAGILPPDRLEVHLRLDSARSDARRLHLQGTGPFAESVLAKLTRALAERGLEVGERKCG